MAIDFSKRGKMSKREYAAYVSGGTKYDYNSDGSPKSGGGDGGGGDDIDSIVQSILGATPGFSEPKMDFDKFYGKKQRKEDRKAAESLYNPFFEKKIADTMEDLNSYAEMDHVSYERTLRQGRAKMAQLGGAIGIERTQWEGEVTEDKKRRFNDQIRNTERVVGSKAIKGAGYESAYGNRIGTIEDERNAAIEEQVLWYQDQAYGQYASNNRAKYQSPSSKNFLGKYL